MLLTAERSAMLVVDIQERLIPAVVEPERVIARTRILLQAADALGIPVTACEQYVKGLGPTVAPVAELLDDSARLGKTTFSCLREPKIRAALDALFAAGRDQIVVCGVEAHVCVLQTVLDLKAAGRQVFVVADAVSSRTPQSVALALDRMAGAGCVVINTEMAVFEWLERAENPAFKAVSALIK
jgi:nicotinamidase-related amidase